MEQNTEGNTHMTAQPGAADEHRLPPSPADVERQFRDAERRARRYWYEDGLGEIAVGSVFVILGGYFAAQALVAGRLGRTADLLLNLLFPAIVLAAGLGMRRIIGKVKERLVYPRAGFANYQQAQRVPKWVTGMIAGMVAGLIAVLLRSAPGVEAWIPAFQGFVMAGFLWWLGRFSGLPRFNLLALISALNGVSVSVLRPSATISGSLFFGGMGLALVVSGWMAFRQFVRASDGAGD